ncbi:hypothetical protein [uncultured Halomonas sp.]|uniref:hypothetical protein n=1 Tax=uncultured Halomonas sp. TaxID=173971 RepID=UPI00261C26FF|nr:hypothetical protein [uncultured Halomonas sp.]
MKWMHKVNPAWLEERKSYLSASDIKKLLPVTPTGRKRSQDAINEAYLKAWAEKQCGITEDDVTSFGPMARGHIMEPYAINEFNRLKVLIPLVHWDDMLIHRNGVACSPDALDVEMPTTGTSITDVPARLLGEVKSYNASMHYVTGLADKMELEERWQLATAFYVIETLEVAALILFNPNAKHKMFTHIYTRDDLKDEIKSVEEISEEYRLWSNAYATECELNCVASADCIDEAAIIEELEEAMAIEHGLNP